MYLLINIYTPNKDTNIIEFFKDLRTTLQKENLDEEESIILGGDFNCHLNPVLDKKGGILLPRKSVVGTDDPLPLRCIIPAIKTDHATISIEFSISEEHVKGPGHWKINCSLLDGEDYVRDVTAKTPISLIEGQNELTDNRSIWDWTKYKIRAHAIQHSKRKAMERKEKETNLQKEFAIAKQLFDSDPNATNATLLIRRKKN